MTINMTWLEGNKTYIIAGCIALISAAQFLGWIPMQTAVALIGLLTGTGVAANKLTMTRAMAAMQAPKG